MMGFDVNSQGNSATVDLPSRCDSSALPPKPYTISTPSVDASKKPAALKSSVSSTHASSSSGGSSGSGGYSLYSLIKKQSQSAPAVEKPLVSSMKVNIASPAKSATSSVSVGLLKKPSGMASSTVEKRPADSAVTATHNAVSFADPVEKSAMVDESGIVRPQRYVCFFHSHPSLSRQHLSDDDWHI